LHAVVYDIKISVFYSICIENSALAKFLCCSNKVNRYGKKLLRRDTLNTSLVVWMQFFMGCMTEHRLLLKQRQ